VDEILTVKELFSKLLLEIETAHRRNQSLIS